MLLEMETSLLVILIFCLSFAALLYYVFIFKKEMDLGDQGKAALFTTVFVILPILVIVIWNQFESKDRLSEIGFTPYPEFVSSVGVATGAGNNPIWVFSTEDDENSILQFYKISENHTGWSLVSETPNSLVFKRKNQKTTIHVGNGNVFFSLQTDP